MNGQYQEGFPIISKSRINSMLQQRNLFPGELDKDHLIFNKGDIAANITFDHIEGRPIDPKTVFKLVSHLGINTSDRYYLFDYNRQQWKLDGDSHFGGDFTRITLRWLEVEEKDCTLAGLAGD
ncbi:hypothetical protein HN832_02385 [archaeon]|jgi:hypothetical protein|nr:hypothetical protein [archaeon]MBT4373202.1 hypothetical protein [archaeon]MBT4531547.1 hypothetical protein [archaeon]MBT7001275.1 hypothetical protein [archaeon]MBT7282239.1 hypothetical protein [archaeon]